MNWGYLAIGAKTKALLLLFCLLAAPAACSEEQRAALQAEQAGRSALDDRADADEPNLQLEGLLPDPQIINAHEHLMDRPATIKNLEAVNEQIGITATVLVASSRFTFYLDKSSFVEYHENNEFLCRLARENPGKYYAFVTFDPTEPDIVPKLEQYLEKGATGVKLYLGHGANIGDGTPFHRFALDDPRILPLYEYCQQNRVPILYHINMHPTKFGEEARRVFDRYPDMPIILPHFGLISGRLKSLDELLSKHPSIVIDVSFGFHEYQRDGLKRISKNRDRFRDFMIKYQDRILFGTDVVITGGKKPSFIAQSFVAYRNMLERDQYRFFVKAATGKGPKIYDENFRGLKLPPAVLRKIYHDNFVNFLARLKVRPAIGPQPPPADN